MEVAIHPFTPADIEDAFALWRASEGIGLFGDSAAVVADCLARSPGLSFVARDGGALVGAALCTTDGRRGYLHHVAVARTHRRRGLGKALAERSLAALEAQGVRKAHLFVQRPNAAAAAFWAHVGWVERTDVIMMSRVLADERP